MRFYEGVKTTVLDNGFMVVTDHFPNHARTAAAIVWASGGFHDPDGRSGTAHLVEHMFTHAHPWMTQSDFRRLVIRLAIDANITTHRDHVQAHAFGRTASVMDVLDKTALMIIARRIDADRLVHERGVVAKEQTDELNDRESAYRYRRLASIFGENSRAVRPEGGYPHEIMRLGRDELLDFWHDHAVGANMMFVSAGGLSHEDAVAFCKAHFAHLPTGYRRERFGDKIRMTDVTFPQEEYQGVSFWARARFDVSTLYQDETTARRLDLMQMFLTEALHESLRLEDGTLYGGAKVAFASASNRQGFLNIHAECTPDDYIPVFNRIAETLCDIASGHPKYEPLFVNARDSVGNIVAEHAAMLSENMGLRRLQIVDALLHGVEMPDVLGEQRILESTTYGHAADIARRTLASPTPTTEYWGHIDEGQMNGRQMAAFLRRRGTSGMPMAAVA